MKIFPVIPQDREMVTRYFAQSATGNTNADCPEMFALMSDGSRDNLPMVQLAAFIRLQNENR